MSLLPEYKNVGDFDILLTVLFDGFVWKHSKYGMTLVRLRQTKTECYWSWRENV